MRDSPHTSINEIRISVTPVRIFLLLYFPEKKKANRSRFAFLMGLFN